MKRHTIELLWGWFDALRRRDTEAMAARLHPDVVWQGVTQDLVCHGPDEVIAAFLNGYDANQHIDSLELFGTDRNIVLGVRGSGLGDIADGVIGDEIYNVFTIEDGRITRIEDYLERDDALRAADGD
jgi:ketosteroid isomerase-like protein